MKRLRVILVDDESIVLSDMRDLIDWEAHGFEICGWAYGAEYALWLVRQHRPDIVFLDISLPGMDGLELAKAIREIQPGITMVILSGYKNFDYAQKAMDLGIMTYLVKHQLTAESLLDTLSKARERIERQEQEQTFVRRQILSQLLDGVLTAADLGREQRELLACYHRPFLFFAVACVAPYFRKDADVQCGIADTVQALVDETGEQPGDILVSGSLVLALQPLASDEAGAGAYLRDAHDRCARVAAALSGDVPLWRVVTYPASPTPLSELRRRHQLLQEAAAQSIFSGERVYRACPAPPDSGGRDIAAFLTRNRFHTHGEEMVRELRERLERACADRDRAQFDALAGKAADLLLLLGMPAEQFQLETGALYGAREVAEYLLERLGEQQGFLLAADPQYSHATGLIIEYINSHYDKQPTIQEAAALLGGNGTYLGQKFKKETGKSFNEYLTECRVRRAQALLAETNMKLVDVSRRVGISNSHYFSKIFQEHTGMAPLEYRRQHYGIEPDALPARGRLR